jgi:hypothetical protein
MTGPLSLATLAVPLGLEPMEAKLVTELPEAPGWQFEPKWDGFRCLAYRASKEVELRAKSGKPLARYFPEVVAMLKALPQSPFVLDGELAVPIGDTLSFDALQMRIHPADSRIKKLSVETPALLVLFDMLLDAKGNCLIEAPLVKRRAVLESFYKKAGESKQLKLSPCTRKRVEALEWLKDARGALDGVVAKRSDGAYVPGERAMLKVKHLRTADCVVPLRERRPRCWLVAARALRRRGKAQSCRFHLDDHQRRETCTHQSARSSDRVARLHREGSGRAEPLEHRALGRMAAAQAKARGRGALRSGDRRPFPPRHQANTLPS